MLRVRLGQLPSGDFGLMVVNPGGTVIIDGTSDMFKIAATSTISVPSHVGTPFCQSASVTLSTGFTYAPMILGGLADGANIYPTPRVDADLSTGGVAETDILSVAVVNTNQTQVTATVCHDASTGSTPAHDFRYYVLQEAAL